VFARLEKKELISSYEGDVSLGGRRRYYTITPLGRALFKEEVEEWRKTKEIIDIFMEMEELK
jgi:PadR family transcriptional regulator PadR